MKSKHKIIHVIETLGVGGAEKSLVENLSVFSQNFSHVVVFIRGPYECLKQVDRNSIPVYNLEVAGRYAYHKVIPRILKIIKREKPSLLHTTLYHANVCGRIAGFLSGTKVLSSVVSASYDSLRYQYDTGISPLKHKIIKMMDRYTGKMACHFIAISEYAKRSYAEHCKSSPQRISVIYRGVNTERFSRIASDSGEDLKKSYGLSSAYPILLNVGRLIPAKGQHYLISAMPSILKEFPSAHLLIAGQGYLQNDLKKAIRNLKLEDSVTLLGLCDEIPQLHAMSDLFVFPCFWEGLGISLIEAMAMEQPVIASKAGPFSEIIENNKSGILVEPGSAESIAAGVIRLCSDHDHLISMGRRGRKIVEDKFDISKNVRQLERLYDEIISGGHISVGL